MTAEIIGQLVQRLQKGESSPFNELVALTAQDVRLFVASYVPTTALVDQVTKEIYAAVKSEIARCPASVEAPAWIIRTAMTLLGARLNDATYQATMARDPLVQVVSQAGLVALAANMKGDNDVAVRLPKQLQFQPPSLQLIIKRHYGEGMSVANLAQAQGLAESDIAQSLVSARARLDWSGAAGVIDTADHTFPKLIEDYMAGVMASEARALLIASVVQDEQRSVQFDRQMRMHLWLSIYFTPYDQETIRALVQSLPARDDSSRLVTPGARPNTTRLSRTAKPGSGPKEITESARVRRNTSESRPPTRTVRRTDSLPGSLSGARAGTVAETDENTSPPSVSEKLRRHWPIVVSVGLIAILFIGAMIAWATSGKSESESGTLTVTNEDPSGPPKGDINYGIIHRVEGEGSLTRKGIVLPATSGEAIASGDAFVTKGTSVIGTLINDQVRLTLGHDTTVPGIAKNEKTIISQLQIGRLGADIRKGPHVSTLIVQTPQSRIEQLDSGSLVEVVQGVTRVQVSRGVAKISRVDGSATIDAKAGSVVLIRDGVDPAIEGSGVFVRGVNFGEGSVTIDGNSWLSQREAEGAGMTFFPGTKLGESALISGQGLDFDSKRMYDRGLISDDGKVGLNQVLPNGDYNLAIWVAGTAEASWKDLQLSINGEVVALGPVADKADRWRRLGPFRFTVKEKSLALVVSGLSKTHLAGLALNAAGELDGTLPPMVVITSPEPNYSGHAFDLEIYARTDNSDTVAKISYYNGETLLGEVDKAPYSFKWQNPPPGEFNLTAVATDTSGTSNRSGTVKGTVQDFSLAKGVLMEVWKNIGGNKVDDLRNHKRFGEAPSTFEIINSFKGAPRGDNSGVRYRAYLTPPQDGDYLFQICGDDACELWLSTDENPAKRVRICTQKDYADENQFNKFPEQTSTPIPLKKDTRYYIEALLKQAGGFAHLTVGWKKPDGKEERPIPGNFLNPCRPGSETTAPTTVKPQTVVIANAPSPIPPLISEPIPEAPAGALLSGKGAAATGIVNLSLEGNVDWIHYGEKNATTQNRKANGSGELSVVRPNSGADIKHYGDSSLKMSWGDGYPTVIKAVSTGGIYSAAKGKGLTFMAPADPILRQLKVWVGAHDTKGTITATVSDNSSRPFTDTFDSSKGKKNQVYTILYRSDKPGQTLTIKYEPPGGDDSGNITVQAVALDEFGDGKRRFIMGVNLEGESQQIDGNQWLGQKEASAFGFQVKNDRRVSVGSEPKPAVDAAMKKMLNMGIAARGGELEISQKLGNGKYEVTVYMLETVIKNSHLFDVRVNDVFLSDIGQLDKGEWAAYGPVLATVDIGTLTLATVTKKGTPQLMGYSVYAPARQKGVRTNAFPNGVAHAIPGMIYLANFDNGGVGKAFHEPTDGKGNEGGTYRPGPVDIGDTGGIPVIGWINRGEWLRYTTSVAEVGTYSVKVSFAKDPASALDPAGESISMEIDGKPVGIPGIITQTVNWGTFKDADLGTVTLSAGIHDLRLLFNGSFNAKTITLTKTN